MKKKVMILLAMAMVGLVCLNACAPLMEDGELREVVTPLIERSLVVNELFFGKGLPEEEEDYILDKYLAKTKQTREQAAYYPVDSSCEFQNEKSIRTFTDSVYASAYAKYLMQLGFYGVAPGDDDEVAMGLVPVIYARYKTVRDIFLTDDEVLCVRRDLDEDDFRLAATRYDYETVKYKKDGKTNGTEWILFSVTAYISDESHEEIPMEVSLKIVNEANGWRLDSPTYFSKDILDNDSKEVIS